MNVTVIDNLVLASFLAILMLGYSQRRATIIQVVRKFADDRKAGDRHHKQDKQMLLHRKRLALLTAMMALAGSGAIATLLSVLGLVYGWNGLTKVTFVAGLILGAFSLMLAIRETALSNAAVYMELDITIATDDPYYKAPSS